MAQEPAAAPTMIIPAGTEIEVDAHGQLSIRAPGNLVIQNSGSYGKLESMGGSIRIDQGVEVEAVSVRCAAGCYVQGSLTAWKVTAALLQLEDSARANVVLQETGRLEIGRNARLVGNFSNEKDLFVLFSRFARQVRELPFYFDRRREELAPPEPGPAAPERRPRVPLRAAPEPAAATAEEGAPRDRLPEPLYFALVLLERDAARKSYGPTSQRAVDELVKLLAERDLETLRHTWRTLFGRLVEPHEDARRAAELVGGFYDKAAQRAG
jgi:hypothetical protein